MGKPGWRDQQNRPVHRNLRCELFCSVCFLFIGVELFPIQLVFVMTARMTACRDLTNNEGDLKRIRELFLTLRTSATPTSLVFPWFPSQARKTGKQATTELYTLLYTYVETRRHAELTSDAIDVLIADGETTQKIVGVSPALEVA